MSEPYFDLLGLLEAGDGVVEGALVDAGMQRKFSCKYEFSRSGDLLSLKLSRGRSCAILPAKIPLTRELIAFLGMYSGDGNKTGQIGFAQRNVQLLEAACRGFRLFFGSETPLAVNLLNDTRYYMRPEFAEMVQENGLVQEELDRTDARDIPQGIRDHFVQEFADEVRDYPLLRSITNLSVTISPKKGARNAGEESREYIVNLPASGWLLPIFLKLIDFLNSTLSKDEQIGVYMGRGVLDWGSKPSAVLFETVKILPFIQASPLMCWYTRTRQERRYAVTRVDDDGIEIGGPDGIKMPVSINIGPISSFGAGLYLAEGTSNKAVLLNFSNPDHAGQSVALSFNSSENTSLSLFLASVRECLGDSHDVVSSWKVKVGSQYMYEMQVLGEFFQAPMVRQGLKGQGKAPSCVQAGYARSWALQEFPSLATVSDRFSHIEYTGAGVMRVQLTCGSKAARLLFGLYRVAIGGLV